MKNALLFNGIDLKIYDRNENTMIRRKPCILNMFLKHNFHKLAISSQTKNHEKIFCEGNTISNSNQNRIC